MLNKACFLDAKIVLSNQLDELVIWQIISQIQEESHKVGVDPDELIRRLIYGVGIRLITSEGSAALDGVYKLAAIQRDSIWQPAIKISETPAKTLNPGKKQVWRLYDQRNNADADLICLGDENPSEWDEIELHHPTDHAKKRIVATAAVSKFEPLLVDIISGGERIYEPPAIDEMRCRREIDEEHLDSGVKRLFNPHVYHVSLRGKIWDLKQQLIGTVKMKRKKLLHNFI